MIAIYRADFQWPESEPGPGARSQENDTLSMKELKHEPGLDTVGALTWEIDGVIVVARYSSCSGEHRLVEVRLEAEGASAAMDIPAQDEDMFVMLIEQAADCFATSLRIRRRPRAT